MIYTNQWLIELIKENWMGLILLYSVIRAMFPNSKMLTATGEAFSNLFPVFRKKE